MAASRSGRWVSTRIAERVVDAAKENPCVSSSSQLYWHSRWPTFTSPRASRAGAASRCGSGLAGSFVAGALLLNNERTEFRMKTVAALHGEQPVLRGLLDSGRRVLAGLLLMLPGIASDVVALVLLALPLNVGRAYEPLAAGAGRWPRRGDFDAIDGDYRRVD